MNTLKELYRDTIRQHAADPVGYRRPIDATHRCEGHNPQCGDRIEVSLRLDGDQIAEIAFDGEACAICMASASLMCEQLSQQAINELSTLAIKLSESLRDRDGPEDLGPFSPLLGVRPYPSRTQCAILPWDTALEALE